MPKTAHVEPPLESREDPIDFVRRFTEAWARPQLERFVAMLAPDVKLTQPVTPPVIGREAARREFARLLHWLPDLHGIVDSWAASGETVLIAWRLCFTLGGKPYELRIVDRILARDGAVAEREAYFDSLRFFLATVARPAAWIPYLRYRGFLPGGAA